MVRVAEHKAVRSRFTYTSLFWCEIVSDFFEMQDTFGGVSS